jgi:uncharacterized protein YcbX
MELTSICTLRPLRSYLTYARLSNVAILIPRFRPNIVVRGAGIPWAEDMWENVKFGENETSISLVSKCTRCLVSTLPCTVLPDQPV